MACRLFNGLIFLTRFKSLPRCANVHQHLVVIPPPPPAISGDTAMSLLENSDASKYPSLGHPLVPKSKSLSRFRPFSYYRCAWLRHICWLGCLIYLILVVRKYSYVKDPSQRVIRPGQFQHGASVAFMVDELAESVLPDPDDMGMTNNVRFVTIEVSLCFLMCLSC